MCFSSIFFSIFFFAGGRAGYDTSRVCTCVCICIAFFIQAKWQQQTRDLQHWHFHKGLGPRQQIQHSFIQGTNITAVRFLSVFSLASQLPSYLPSPVFPHTQVLHGASCPGPAAEAWGGMSSLPKALQAVRYQCVAGAQFVRHWCQLSGFSCSADCKEELAGRQSTSPGKDRTFYS